MAVTIHVVILILFLISVDNHGVEADKIILKKCCPFKSYMNESINESLGILVKTCVKVGSNLHFDDLKMYDSDLHLTGRSVKDVFELNATGPFNLDEAFDIFGIFGFNMYLVETGVLYMEFPNDWERWIKVNNSNFCIDYLVTEDKPPTPRIWAILTLPEQKSAGDPIYLSIALLISCVFLALVLVVYMLVSELRNLKGLILMAYVATLLTAFLLLAVLQLVQTWDHLGCQLMTYSIYFSFLASFCWMNVMSFDIWRAVRQENHVRFMFRIYSAYAFGVPLAMTAFFVTVNHVPMRHLPWFITPNVPQKGCFIVGYAKLLYLYVPMMILILLNWTFFLMTAFELWSHHRKTKVLDTHGAGPTPAHRQHRARWNMFLLYLKLYVIMGINWILEAVSSFAPDLSIWIVTDLYNILTGLSIFVIFVCDRSTLRKLKKRLQTICVGASFAGTRSHSSHTTSSDASQEAILQVCSHPNGTSKHDRTSERRYDFK